MAKTWTRREAVASAVLTAEALNAEFDHIAGQLQGGLDRTSTEPAWLDHSHLVDNALHRVTTTTTAIEMPAAYMASAGSANTFSTVTYAAYGGGWTQAHSETITGRNGVLHVEFSCLLWQQLLYAPVSPKGTEFRILWDGVPVAVVGPLYQAYANPYIVCDIPVGGGGTLSVDFRFSPGSSGEDDPDDAQMFFGGGQIIAIGRWR